MKIGIYVGSFNPVHKGHIHLIEQLLEKNVIDWVNVIATEGYWHKKDLLPLENRIKMLKEYETKQIRIEEKYNFLPYTYQILEAMKKEYPQDQLYLLIGADQLPDFPKWQHFEDLLKYHIIVIPRNQIDAGEYIKTFPKDTNCVVANLEEIDISSTEIRKAIQTGENLGILKEYLHPKVLSYIRRNHYYEKEKRIVMLEEIVKQLAKEGKTISTMESCTGGGLANAITNIPGASEVFHFGAVTYSNDYKIKMGVPKEVIDTYTVYSRETASSMAKAIQAFTGSDYGVGVTGKLSKADPNNPSGKDDQVFVAIYEKETNHEYSLTLQVEKTTRKENKDFLIEKIMEEFSKIL